MQQLAAVGALIASHPFTSGLNPRFLSFLEDCASLRRFSSHQRIFEEGSDADHFYLIVSGKVILEALLPDGGSFTVQTLGAGEALGWSWLFSPYRWSFTAVTTAPTEVVSFGARFLREKAATDAQFASELLRRIARVVVERLQVTRKELVQLAAP